MTRMPRRLTLALACSLLLHILPFLPGLIARPVKAPAPPALEALLRSPPPAPAAEPPPLRLPEPPPRPAKAEPPRQPKPEKAPAPLPNRSDWTREIQRQFKELHREGRYYPEEAIAQGIEGEAVVFILLDEAGNVAAARIEVSSGHRILDDAALRAARSLKSLPAAAPRETLLPVRFRLR